ncbi:hypothetical protein B9Z55_026711 [Caenorhabditis nigoni]|uniref:Uncharacterized protein n=1 Tax=Caenorhabditis nigoni TaxID=1611254 RepID=A0A2G5T3Y5_9PELO|nr:hypothetical protein B9Z55_026711 [Caenorhabditis nigoni]
MEDLEENQWKFPEYPLIRYYRYQTRDLDTRLRWSGIIGKDLDDEDEAFEKDGYVEPVGAAPWRIGHR